MGTRPKYPSNCDEASLAISATNWAASADRPQRSLQVAIAAAGVARDNKGQDIVLLDLRELTAVFDFFLVVTGSSSRQLHAIADEIKTTLAQQFGEKRLGMEGYAAGTWILQDYGDVVIHLFDEKARDYYSLEQLWSDARRVDWESPPGPRIAKTD
jgi:ribosome-associated protein